MPDNTFKQPLNLRGINRLRGNDGGKHDMGMMMDENVRKAPSLLDELERVVRDIDVAESWDCTGDLMRCLDGSGCECAVRGCDRPDVEGDAVNFIRTHHAEIAAAVKDARRYRWLRSNACDGFMRADGGSLNCDEPESEWDAWIDASMNNSAREDGE